MAKLSPLSAPSELKESLSRMGSDLKHGFISSLKTAWQTLNDFARAHTSSPQLQAELEKVANQIKEEEEKQEVGEVLTAVGQFKWNSFQHFLTFSSQKRIYYPVILYYFQMMFKCFCCLLKH